MLINLFDISLLLQRYPINKAKKELLFVQNNFANNSISYQKKKKWEIFNHHIANNKAYNKFVGGTKIYCWEDIPVLTKQNIQAPLIERLTDGYSGKKIHLHNTSGVHPGF